VSKSYDQYCPMARALDLVGERWTLLIVRELLPGPKRYTDLAAALPGIGTNILACRLKDLEAHGILEKHRLPPPAASQVYELTTYGHELKSVLRALAVWGVRSLGPPEIEKLSPGWLVNAVEMFFEPAAPPGRFVFRIGDEVVSLVDGRTVAGEVDEPDVTLECTPNDLYYLFFERRFDGVELDGDRERFERLLDAAAAPVFSSAAAVAV
jgi:DNA-binding HxlR family transcriptional regulator